MILVLDSETSGLLRDDLPSSDPSQPHIVQLGAILFDARWTPAGKLVCLIKPAGWTIEPEAEAVHGISEQRCHRYGIDVCAALSAFADMVQRAETVVAHNMQFDRRVIEAALAKIGAEGGWWRRAVPKLFCTMESNVDVLRIDGQFGWRFPSLEETYRYYYPDREYQPTHSAEADVLACAEIYRAMKGER